MGLVYNGVGMGAGATGGWGDGVTAPKLMIVTSLTDSASPGSATATGQSNSYTCNERGALEASGNRVVIYRIGGTHTLAHDSTVASWPDNGSITVTNDNLTVLGQTAPGGGVTVRGVVSVQCSNTIWEHCRFRGTDDGTYDGGYSIFRFGNLPVSPWSVTSNHYMRHCTISWGSDETMAIDGSSDVTVENCLVGSSIKGSRCFFTSTGGFSTSQRYTIYRNIMWAGQERHPVISNAVELINNYVAYNGATIGTLLVGYQAPSFQTNIIKNYYAAFSGSSGAAGVYEAGGFTYSTPSRIYLAGNIDTVTRPTDSGAETLVYRHDGNSPRSTILGTKINLGGANWIIPSEILGANVKSDLLGTTGPGAYRRQTSSGTFENYRDAVDTSMRTYLGNTPPWGPLGSGSPGNATTVDQASMGIGWESLAAGTAPTDTNQDGIPDSYTLPPGALWFHRRVDGYPFLYGYVYGLPRYWDDPPGEPFNVVSSSPFTVNALNTPVHLDGLSVYHEGETIDTVELESSTGNAVLRVGALGTKPTGVTITVPP